MMEGGCSNLHWEQVRELERALFVDVLTLHRKAGCSVHGKHAAECRALIEQIGWPSFERYVSAMQARAAAM